MLLLASAFCLLGNAPLGAQQNGRSVVLTFDDLVGQTTVRTTENYAAINRGIRRALQDAAAPAIAFVNERTLYEQGELLPDRVDILRAWLTDGFELGNHTYSHPNLHEVPVRQWLDDFDRGETVLKTLWEDFAPAQRYLRHPYLRTGQSDAVRAQVAEHLAKKDYRVAPVTIDNQEWIFARAFDVAVDRGDGTAADAVAVAYVDYMVAMFEYYEDQSEKIVGRQMPHILLLHGNRLNAEALPELLSRIRERGYRFNSLDEALRDPAFERPDGYYGPAGITWLHRWALADGMPGSTFAGEPQVPAFVMELFEGQGR